MMLRYYGVDTDPGAFNAWLTANGGYAFDDELIWDAVSGYTGGRIGFSQWRGPDLGLIQGELDAGRPVVAEVQLGGNQHFELITGYTSAAGLLINEHRGLRIGTYVGHPRQLGCLTALRLGIDGVVERVVKQDETHRHQAEPHLAAAREPSNPRAGNLAPDRWWDQADAVISQPRPDICLP